MYSKEQRSGKIETAIRNDPVVSSEALQDARPSICIVVAAAMTIEVFLLEQIAALMPLYQVTVVANCPDKKHLRKFGLDLDIQHVPMCRDIAPLQDLKCLFRLFLLFRARNFAVVHSITPKAGLLSMVGAVLARVPLRVHTFTGQVWATTAGWKRAGLKSLDRILAMSATHILADSRSQLKFLAEEGVVKEHRADVLGSGSISGVDIKRFQPRQEEKWRIRRGLDIPDSATVFGFIGRIKKDKGVLDLARAFGLLPISGPKAYLMIAGPDEENLTRKMIELSGGSADRIRFVSWTQTPEFYMTAFDLLCLPSYREGFGSVIIEAAACGVPTLASRIYGISDAVVDGVTGMLHECGDVAAIAAGMKRALDEPEFVKEMGRRAQNRARTEFSSARLSAELVGFYSGILSGTQKSGG